MNGEPYSHSPFDRLRAGFVKHRSSFDKLRTSGVLLAVHAELLLAVHAELLLAVRGEPVEPRFTVNNTSRSC
ncbi:MAG TPA: hypothetical protein PLX58_08580 [Smithellaceae bacterium]|jgi:hypothetical protein|nr:hypothetical protein [Smithellaceae bacterium]HQF85013.1 hypothetical protein [Smithellaceae bacterium]HQG80691.1 hypothetical protein [Smithellaceae bacterium]